MGDEFARAVEDGLRLSKRIYTGKERNPPRPADAMARASSAAAPTAPLLCAVIGDPAIVDNPDIPSYQPHVYGRCDPPALIPLQMKEIELEVDCFLDTAFVAVTGRWRLHCVMGSRSCDCRLVVPVGEQGSILGVNVDVDGRSYSSQLIQSQGDDSMRMNSENEDWYFLKPQFFSLTIPQVAGGSDISLKVCWSQKLLYKNGHFSVSVPFNFPEYVTPFAKLFSKHEKIRLNVNTGTENEIFCQTTSHALKEKIRQAGKLAFLYEAEVDHWSRKDFFFSYSVYSKDIFGALLTQSPSMDDHDQREMFCLYLQPGSSPNMKVFSMAVVFLVDISGSMQGMLIEKVKSVVSANISELSPNDHFGIIAFNEKVWMFSPSLVEASKDMVENAIDWIDKNFSAEGGTNIAQALDKAVSLLDVSGDLLPHIFLITDGSIEDEQKICHTMKGHVPTKGLISPRVSTFGIGTFVNHYFLRMLSSVSGGHYDAAYDPDSIEDRMGIWLRRSSSPVVANIMTNLFDDRDANEIYPSLPDVTASFPLIVFGRCKGKLPDKLGVKGSLADGSDFFIDLKVREAKDIPLEKLFAKQQIDLLTAQAWFSQSKLLEEKIAKLSLLCSIPSEYTYMSLHQTRPEQEENAVKQTKKTGHHKAEAASASKERHLVRSTRLGFGDIQATAENLPACSDGRKHLPEALIVVHKAIGCCGQLSRCCCMGCLNGCSKLNDQCIVVFAQLCAALACLACFECCAEVCCKGD